MLRKLLLYAALLTLTQCSQCKKNDPAPLPPKDPLTTLPPETQTGAGTFGCLVNGKAYFAPYTTATNGDWQGFNTIFLSAATTTPGNASETFGIGMLLNGNLSNGQKFDLVKFNQPVNLKLNQFVANANTKTCGYYGDYIKTGQVELVKFDPVARIASGRFAFTLYEPNSPCDTLRVSNGRFDIKF